ncbi:hypothetical protein Golax_001914 [Gossypium laxum]|uniref:Uncharacterized protein n=1 Tax=Gossypium laxum TaxID=34288 RepID=A0A7J9ARP2_9ROSI|nr:hypothetical protein [Gossypium laxum]
MIGLIFCIDAQTDAAVRGQFARLAISVDLKKNHWFRKLESMFVAMHLKQINYGGGCDCFWSLGAEKSGFQTRVKEEAFGGSRFVVLEVEREKIRADNHVASELNGAGVFEENSVMLLTRNETMVEGKKCVISSIRKVMDATGGEVGVRRRDVRVKGKG